MRQSQTLAALAQVRRSALVTMAMYHPSCFVVQAPGGRDGPWTKKHLNVVLHLLSLDLSSVASDNRTASAYRMRGSSVPLFWLGEGWEFSEWSKRSPDSFWIPSLCISLKLWCIHSIIVILNIDLFYNHKKWECNLIQQWYEISLRYHLLYLDYFFLRYIRSNNFDRNQSSVTECKDIQAKKHGAQLWPTA